MKKKKVLLVDDEEEILELMSDLLRDRFKVIKSANGQEALFKYRNEPFDLVIVDIHMPKMTGLEFITEMRKFEERDKDRKVCPAIITTGDMGRHLLRDIAKWDAVVGLEKPISLESLNMTIEKMLRGKDVQGSRSFQKFIEVPNGQNIFNTGDYEQNIYFVVDGEFEVFVERDGKEILLGKIYKGEMIGEMSFFMKTARNATVKAVKDSKIVSITGAHINAVIAKQPPWFKPLLLSVIKRLRASNLEKLGGEDIEQNREKVQEEAEVSENMEIAESIKEPAAAS